MIIKQSHIHAVSIIVVDTKGQRSIPTVTEMTIGMENTIFSKQLAT